MKRFIIIFQILVLAAVITTLHSCTEGSIYPTVTDNDPGKFSIDSGYYPNTVGTYWRYEIMSSDSIPYVMDTVEVRLASNVTQIDSSQLLTYYYFYYQYSNNFSTFEILNKDTVRRLNNPNVPFISYLIIPFSIGTRTVESIVDSSYNTEEITVTMLTESFDSVTVRAGTFGAFKITTTVEYGRFGTSKFFTKEILRFVPFVGYISYEYEYWDDYNQRYFSKEKWELLDYNIVKK